MALFEFELEPLQEIEPWQGEFGPCIHWFGLTSGVYHLNVNGEQLFRFSEEILDSWARSDPDMDRDKMKYFDYAVARLYDDMMDIIPCICQPVPNLLHQCISPLEKYDLWNTHLSAVYESTDDEVVEDMYLTSRQWLQPDRSPDGLGGGTHFWFWRVGDAVHIQWDSRGLEHDGVNLWAAEFGEWQLPFESFILEVQSFHDRLMEEMEQRVNLIIENNPIPHMNIDIQGLLSEHQQRKKILGEALSLSPKATDWDYIIETNQKMLMMTKER